MNHNEPGICPLCGSGALVYGSSGINGDSYFYSWECKDCGACGKEWYDLVFSEHTIESKGEEK